MGNYIQEQRPERIQQRVKDKGDGGAGSTLNMHSKPQWDLTAYDSSLMALGVWI